MLPLLPQGDPNITERRAQLAQAQSLYQYNYTYVPPLAMVEKVPSGDGFTFSWLIKLGKVLITILLNDIASALPEQRDEFKAKHSSFSGRLLAASLKQSDSEVEQIIAELASYLLNRNSNKSDVSSLEAYSDLFSVIPLPPISQNFTSNDQFARLRVAGFNPLVIKRVAALDARFPLTDAQYQTVFPGDTLASAGAEGRLYLADYAELSSVQGGTFPLNKQKYVYAPLALFAVPKHGKSLTPIAIQCNQAPSPTNPIFLCQADEDPNWILAKTIVQIADVNYHEMISHLARCHMFIEPFAIATPRRLADNHPLAILLKPHFQGTLKINDTAQVSLIAPDGIVDSLLGGAIASSRALCVHGFQSYQFNQSLLPVALKHRGVDDPQLLPDYPYRDDALLVWDAIRAWVEAYLTAYYHDDSDVGNDIELQAWAQELISQDGGRVVDFGENGQIRTLFYLIDAVTMIIFTASAQHASLNFPQSNIIGYTPGSPTSGYAPAPTQTTGATEADFLAMLPPVGQAKKQLEMGYLLGSVYYSTLGNYERGYFSDRQVSQPLRDFQDRLRSIESEIETRNETRFQPYEYLLPSKIPQSINI
jgi:arachidonate 15-lipoxygenase